MPRLAATVESTPHSGIRRMAELARLIPDVIRLEAGDPSFNTAPHIRDAAFAAMGEGYTKYTPSGGFAVAPRGARREGRAAQRHRRRARADHRHRGRLRRALHLADDAPRPGRRGARARPGLAELPGADPRPRRELGRATRSICCGGSIDPERRRGADHRAHEGAHRQLAQQPERRGLRRSRRSPSSPTCAPRHDLWVISDECYDELAFDVEHVSLAAVAPSERVDHGLLVLEDLRDDRLAHRLRRRAAAACGASC